MNRNFDVVIFTGDYTASLAPFDNVPRCLLPIGNKPMLAYWLEQADQQMCSSAIVAVYTKHRSKVESFVKKELSKLSIKVDFHSVKNDLDCLEALRDLSPKLQNDFLLINGQSLLDYAINSLADFHYVSENFLTVCIFEKKAPAPFSAILGVEEGSNRVVQLLSHEDVDSQSDRRALVIKPELIRRFPNVKLRSNISESGVYLFDNRVLKLFNPENEVNGLEDYTLRDLVKFLVSHQVNGRLHKLLGEKARDQSYLKQLYPEHGEANRKQKEAEVMPIRAYFTSKYHR